MLLALEVLLGAGCAVVGVPALVLLVEAVAALLPDRRPGTRAAAPPRIEVLVPAHDEEGQIEATVRALQASLPPGARLLVIADNCGDRTAELAAAAGATVVERRDPGRLGKGFAISFGLRQLDGDPPEVVILVDADCRVSAGGLSALGELAARSGRPVQAEYVLTAPPDAARVGAVGALAVLVRNRVRPRGLRRLGLPCHLTGSGMAFPWRLLRDAPETGSNLVEDLVLGIELALRGAPPLSCPEVQISSELPTGAAAGRKQRRRWEHGQLHTLAVYVPRLLGAGLIRRRADLLALGLDLAVPPLALLVLAQLALLGGAAALALPRLVPARAAAVCALPLAWTTIAVAASWARFGRRTLPLRRLLLVPLYLLWKIPLYVELAVRGKQKKWERTARGASKGVASS
jgi:cellulose synthase/poly-beta-1,6-N-acetylglucosamine synthase-like glycosyltransferase